MMGERDDDCAQTGDATAILTSATFKVAGSRFGRAEEGKGEDGGKKRRTKKRLASPATACLKPI